jgi:hypothetical protein
MSRFEHIARSNKAFVLADAIYELCRSSELDPYANAAEIAAMLTHWPAEAWTMLAVSIGQKPPSPTTQALVVARVLSRAERRVAS